MMNFGFLKASLKPLLRRYFTKVKPLPGDGCTGVCENIVKDTWNGSFYQTGLGHFNYFWIRDFGVVAQYLIHLGHNENVKKTIHWALKKYRDKGKVALSIDKDGNTFNAPMESIDALAWLVYSISISGYELTKHERDFLNREIHRFKQLYIDPETKEIRPGNDFAELRDAVSYNVSSYAVLMVHILSKYSNKLGLKGFEGEECTYKETLLEKYWNGSYFNADLNNNAFSAESNLFPFTLKVFTDKEMLNEVLSTIKKKKLAHPYPLKYTDTPNSFKYRWWSKIIMPNYASTTIWTWMGALYLQLLKAAGSEDYEKELKKFSSLVKRYKNFPELLSPDGNWYKTPFYKADEGMVWSAIYLSLYE